MNPRAPGARPGHRPGHVVAPFQGYVTVVVRQGERVVAGQTLAILEAMKMEATITAPRPGTVARVLVPRGRLVDGGDPVVLLDS